MSDSNDKKDGKLSEEDEEPDEWYDQQSSAETQTGSPIPLMESIRDKRIFSTGCSGQNFLVEELTCAVNMF